MKPRFLDAMGDALSLMRQSNLADATALIRRALTRDEAGAPETEADPRRPEGRAIAPPARRPLGEVLRQLRDRPFIPPLPDQPASDPGQFGERFVSRVFKSEHGSLSYRLYMPADHAGRDLALVLMLHGCTQNPDDFATGTRMNSFADEFGLIVAYPLQPRRANASGCWNWFDPRHQNRGSGEPAKLAGLAQALGREFGVGKERTFAAGLSAGGAMAEVLAATYPDVFDAVGVHSGLAYRSATDVASAFAVMKGRTTASSRSPAAGGAGCRKIIIQGGADTTVHPSNSDRILEEAEGAPNPLKQVEFPQIGDGRVSRTVLQDAAGEPVVERWLVEGGGHAWFGGDERGTYTQSAELDASRLMVRFFLRQ